MKVFVSWSGDLSEIVSDLVRKFIKRVIPTIQPFVSYADNEKGGFWPLEMLEELKTSAVAIVCVTRANMHSDWLLFEAGAIAGRIDKGRVCTLLIDVAPAELEHPLSFFQSTVITRDDVYRLIETLHRSLPVPLYPSTDELRTHFDAWWPSFEAEVRDAIKLPFASRSKIQELTDELLLPVIYRTASIGDLDTIFHWLEIARARAIGDLESPLGFVEACLARITGKRNAGESLRRQADHFSKFQAWARVELLLLQFVSHQRMSDFVLCEPGSLPEDVQPTWRAILGLWHFREGRRTEAMSQLQQACPMSRPGGPHDFYRAVPMAVLCLTLGEGELGESYLDLPRRFGSLYEGYPFLSLTTKLDRSFVNAIIGHGGKSATPMDFKEIRGHAWLLSRCLEIMLGEDSLAIESLVKMSVTWRAPLSDKSVRSRLQQFQRAVAASSGPVLFS